MKTTDGTPSKAASAPIGAGERWLLALMAIFLLHVLLFGGVGIVEAISRRLDAPWHVLPMSPMLLVTVSFLMAQCSLAAVAFGRSRLASHWKALLITVLAVGVWVLLQFLISGGGFNDSQAGSWLASLATQGYLVACGVMALQAFASHATRSRRQYTIFMLLAWTTLVAIGLGSVRWLAEQYGWSLDVRTWQHFYALQAVGTFSAILAIGLYAVAARSATPWVMVAAYAGLLSFATTAFFVVFMFVCFNEPGATTLEMCWIMGGQTLFLLAVLIPLKAALLRDELGHDRIVIT
jgi:hypothetical protein